MRTITDYSPCPLDNGIIRIIHTCYPLNPLYQCDIKQSHEHAICRCGYHTVTIDFTNNKQGHLNTIEPRTAAGSLD